MYYDGSGHRVVFLLPTLWVLVLFMLPGIVQAQFRYITNNGTITITQFIGPGTSVTIPAATNGLPVTAIGNNGFYSGTLTNVNIPASVTNIGNWAFAYCSSLTSITVDASNPAYSSSDGILLDKPQVTLVGFPVGRFGSYAIASSITAIGDYAFYGSTLFDITIPGSVTNIGNHAFNSCYSLGSVAIPASVIQIGTDAFSACTSLTEITVDPSNPAYTSSNGVLFDKAQVTLIQAPAGLDGSFTIPNGVVTIAVDAFYQCFNLTSVAFPDSVTSVDDHAFYQCSSLSSVTLPNGLTNIANYAFASCAAITNLTLPNALQSIGMNAFNSCYSLASVTIPKSLISLGSLAFSSCSGLKSASFEGNAPHDTGDAFSGDPLATVYYLPGATGWGSKFGGVPSVLLNPPAQLQAEAPGVVNGKFSFELIGPTNRVVIVQACTNLSNPVWIPVSTNTLVGGTSSFSDSQWAGYSVRFYRLTD